MSALRKLKLKLVMVSWHQHKGANGSDDSSNAKADVSQRPQGNSTGAVGQGMFDGDFV